MTARPRRRLAIVATAALLSASLAAVGLWATRAAVTAPGIAPGATQFPARQAGAQARAQPVAVPPPNATPGDVALTTHLADALAARPLLWGPRAEAGDLQGKVVVVTFFASWCPPCREELAHLAELQRRHGDRLRVLAVNHFETWDGLSDAGRLDNFLRRTALPFTVLAGDEGLAVQFGGVRYIPTLLVFGRDGRPVYRFAGGLPSRGVSSSSGPGESDSQLAALEAMLAPLL